MLSADSKLSNNDTDETIQASKTNENLDIPKAGDSRKKGLRHVTSVPLLRLETTSLDYNNLSNLIQLEIALGPCFNTNNRIYIRKDVVIGCELYLFNDSIYVHYKPSTNTIDKCSNTMDKWFFFQNIVTISKHESSISIDSFHIYFEHGLDKYYSTLLFTIGAFQEPKRCWIPDHYSSSCLICNKRFTFINRRHHCRICGVLICGGCSRFQSSLRICSRCL